MKHYLRRVAEIISQNVVLERRMPKDFGRIPIIVSPGAALHYWLPNLEQLDPMLFDIARRYIQPGQIVWDIGANMGLFTFAASHQVGANGQVLSLEADLWCVDLLRRTCSLRQNRHRTVDVLPVAVSNKVDIARFNIAKRGRATNHLASVDGSTQVGGIRQSQLVPCVSLDWLLERYPRPDFLKIDIEGAEALALEGASNLLSSAKPIILCEVSSKNQKRVMDIFEEHKYELYDAQQPHQPRTKLATFNTLAVPQDSRM